MVAEPPGSMILPTASDQGCGTTRPRSDSLLASAACSCSAWRRSVVGPYVEEYIFRHILIGKLSRWIPTWITVPISILAFTMLHFIGDPDTSFASVLPYLSMAIAFTTVYLLSKKSFAYVWLSHAFNNVVSVLVMEMQFAEGAVALI